MPNHVYQKLTITTPESVSTDDLLELFASKRPNTEDEMLFDFDKILPMPESIKNTECCHNRSISKVNKDYPVPTQETIDAMNAELDQPDLDEERKSALKVVRNQLIALMETGYRNWYDWSVANWGTKWNTYDNHIYIDDDKIEVSFSTAWSMPTPILNKLFKQLSDLGCGITYYAADEGIDYNCRAFEIPMGEKFDHEIYNDEFELLLAYDEIMKKVQC